MGKPVNLGAHDEGQTPLDDVSGLLINISTRADLDRAEFENNLKAQNKYLLKKINDKSAPFTYAWLLKVHSDMFGDVWSWAGKVRTTEMNIGVSPYKIPSEMHSVAKQLEDWEAAENTFKVSVRLHHRLVLIHPFENGNGRWARFLTNIYLHKNGHSIIPWPNNVTRFRPQYLAALKQADLGDIHPLLQLSEGLVAQ